ncbi:MAG: hypothetical protein NTY69_01195 [Methylococcales bacterium]|nr:hypothetical protein [Methylococcales bacterium]
MNNKIVSISLTLSIFFSASTQATLLNRGNGLIYDDVKDITWAADANLFQTQASSNPNLVADIINANSGVINDTPNELDTVAGSGVYSLTTADFDVTKGSMSWWGAMAWVKSLALGGIGGWSLPTTIPANYGFSQADSQMGNLFYNGLGGDAGSSITAVHNASYDLFTNIQDDVYWSSTEFENTPDITDPAWVQAWAFGAVNGSQDFYWKNDGFKYYAWAIHVGDVAALTAVPLPGALWLFLISILGLMRLNTRFVSKAKK